ncbi:hypothetical protein C8R43DRAFT_955971 [Mycena crocata]|nr:hypothetical protein C8R43DRAFT_955971 [Mycena crocata]
MSCKESESGMIGCSCAKATKAIDEFTGLDLVGFGGLLAATASTKPRGAGVARHMYTVCILVESVQKRPKDTPSLVASPHGGRELKAQQVVSDHGIQRAGQLEGVPILNPSRARMQNPKGICIAAKQRVACTHDIGRGAEMAGGQLASEENECVVYQQGASFPPVERYQLHGHVQLNPPSILGQGSSQIFDGVGVRSDVQQEDLDALQREGETSQPRYQPFSRDKTLTA